MKKLLLVTLVVMVSINCGSQSTQMLNPSGVWLYHGIGPLTHKTKFSWGDNPVYNQYTAIDIKAKKPIIYTLGRRILYTKNETGRESFYIFWNMG